MGSWHTGIHSEGSVICTCSAEGPEQAVGPAGAPAALRGARRDELTGDWSRSAEGPLRLDAGVAVLEGRTKSYAWAAGIFDPLGFSKGNLAELKTKEIKNGEPWA